jgi:hypothetical protein
MQQACNKHATIVLVVACELVAAAAAAGKQTNNNMQQTDCQPTNTMPYLVWKQFSSTRPIQLCSWGSWRLLPI